MTTTTAGNKSKAVKLTKSKVESLPLPTGTSQALYWDSETKGFGVRVTSKGVRSYIVQRVVKGAGKNPRFTIGRHGVLTCDEARKRAMAKLLEMMDGINPQTEKKRETAQAETLRDVMTDYLAHKRTSMAHCAPPAKRTLKSA